MTSSAKQLFGLALLAGLLAITGCTLTSADQVDEAKEPHFLEGKARVNALDYAGAIESFERALEVNPKSASAHYEHYLKLRPNGENCERARTRIVACKQELARAVSLGPVTQNLQRDFEQLMEQNKKLTEDNKTLRDELERWEASSATGRPLQPATQPG